MKNLTFNLGDIFKLKFEHKLCRDTIFHKYILAQTGEHEINLINLKEGNRFNYPLSVESIKYIPLDVVEKLFGTNYSVKYYDKKQKKYKLIKRGENF